MSKLSEYIDGVKDKVSGFIETVKEKSGDSNKLRELCEKYKLQIICVLGGFVIFALAEILAPDSSANADYIKRKGYGDSQSVNSIYVNGLEEDEVMVDVSINARHFSDDEIDGAFEKCIENLMTEILGDNEDLQDVFTDLNLKESYSEYGFGLMWESSDRDLVRETGEVNNYYLEEAADVRLTVTITDSVKRDRQAIYEIPIRVVPARLTASEQRLKEFNSAVKKADEADETSEGVRLPASLNGKKLKYRDGNETDYNFIWILGIIIALLLYAKDKQKVKDEANANQKQAQLDYPEIVSKLMVFIGAGMSIRLAWDKICTDYELSGDKRYAYEVMYKSNSRLKTGASEDQVYRDFGREMRSKQYMKLASLLEQNRKTGVAGLKSVLSLEMVEAWEERKNLARRLGEEAGTKLLIPLIMMLGVVMVTVMAPAFMSM